MSTTRALRFSSNILNRTLTQRPATSATFNTFQSRYRREFSTTLPKMTVHNIATADEFKEALAKNPTVFIDWFATWCGPCKMIAPMIAEWSNANPDIYFAKVDVDTLPELSAEHGIRAMPTFTVFHNGEKGEEFLGANPPAVQKLIESAAAKAGGKAA